MISYRELREISLDFRRLSSNLLNATYENADVQIERFKRYIDTTAFIRGKLDAMIKGIDFDYTQCFVREVGGGWSHIRVPADEASHVKAMYDYLTQICEGEMSVYMHARYFSRKSKFNEVVQEFLSDAFKPMIDFLNDAISKEIILVEEEQRHPASPITQNIGTVYGTVNQQSSGNITSYNTTNASVAEIAELIKRIMPALDHIQGIPQDIVENVKDDLDSVAEQIVLAVPKKNRLQKALSGIKKFVSECGMKLAVTWATGKITEVDWAEVIEKIEQFISNLG